MAEAPDFAKLSSRLKIHAIDLRQPGRIMQLCEHMRARQTHLDIVVHNAAQTNRRAARAYAQHLQLEARAAQDVLPSAPGVVGQAFGRLLEQERGMLGAGELAKLLPVRGTR